MHIYKKDFLISAGYCDNNQKFRTQASQPQNRKLPVVFYHTSVKEPATVFWRKNEMHNPLTHAVPFTEKTRQ